jgi:two-component system, OmpR family, sensor histidine kinase TctE
LLNHAMVIHRSEVVALQPVELNALVKEVLGRTIPLADERDVAVTFESNVAHLLISGDRISLQEALSNVLHNALLHGAADEIGVSIAALGSTVAVTVNDNGHGIPAEHWESALRPFVRLGPNGADPRTGSGLGLAIVQEVMKAHSGEVVFSFPASGGFAVTLIFPYAEAGTGDITTGSG